MKITVPEVFIAPLSSSSEGGETEIDGDKVGKYYNQRGSASCATGAFHLLKNILKKHITIQNSKEKKIFSQGYWGRDSLAPPKNEKASDIRKISAEVL